MGSVKNFSFTHPIDMDFLTPWAPTLYGNNLLPCAIISDLVANDKWPLFQRPDEKPWSVAAVSVKVESAGPAKASILKSVLVIWQLKMTQKSTVAVLDIKGVSLKRDLQDSPLRPDPIVKRQCMIEESVPGGLDFSGLQVREFNLISEDQIAGAVMKVCYHAVEE